MPLRRRLVKVRRDGTYELRLDEHERALLRSLVPQLRTLLAEGEDPTTWRLFPNAYQDDDRLAAEYTDMVGDDLLARRFAQLDTLAETVDREVLDESELAAWMGSVNDLRLVIGTRLDVDETLDFDDVDPADDDAVLYAAYGYLGWLMEHLVSAAMTQLDT